MKEFDDDTDEEAEENTLEETGEAVEILLKSYSDGICFCE